MARKQQQTLTPIRDIHVPALPKKRGLKVWWQKLVRAFKQPRVRLAAVAVIVILGGLFAYNYRQTRDELALNDPAKLAAQIGVHLELPTDETPTLATVQDAEKLKSQPFFKLAQDGDKVLIYPKAGKAVLYRPATKKVVEYSPISLGSQ
jgi:hypothetical protein